MADLTKIRGVDETAARKLESVGISTAKALIEQGADPRGRKVIAAQTGIDGGLIRRWLNHIDLFRIKGIGEEYASLLEEVGVKTVRDLARRNPNRLYRQMVKVNRTKQLVRRLPSLAQVEDWIAQAKKLPRVVA